MLEGNLDGAEAILNKLTDHPSLAEAVQENLNQINAKRKE